MEGIISAVIGVLKVLPYIIFGVCILFEVYHIACRNQVISYMCAMGNLAKRGIKGSEVDDMTDEEFFEACDISDYGLKVYSITHTMDKIYWLLLIALVFLVFPMGLGIFIIMVILSVTTGLCNTVLSMNEKYDTVKWVIVIDAVASILVYVVAIMKYYQLT